MTDQEILNQRDPDHKYYKSLNEFYYPDDMLEIEDDYGFNRMREQDPTIIYHDDKTKMKVFNPVYDEESNDYYFRITRGNGFIQDPDNNDKNILNSNFRIIRILLSQPNYQLHSEDIFTEEEKDIFNKFVSNNWDKVIESSKNMYYILGESIPKEFPLLVTDFSSLTVKN